MEIHAPHEPVRSLKDFLYHMLTIVLGILIALGLEGLVEWNHHRHLVSETRQLLNFEIRENQAHLKQGLSLAPAVEQHVRSAIQLAQARENSHTVVNTALDLSFGLFPLSSTNWNTAQSSGALGLMEESEVQRYTRIYTVQQAFLAKQDNTLNYWMELQKWAPFLDAGRGINGFSELDLDQFKMSASLALIHLQTEESIAQSLNAAYETVTNAH